MSRAITATTANGKRSGMIQPVAPVIPQDRNADRHVAILLASFNGEPFIRDQLGSILNQDHTNWSLWISDDGSADGTREHLEVFRDTHPDRVIHLRNGPRRGSMRNFLGLLCDTSIDGDYYSFADQDDLWLPGKLTRALDLIATAPSGPVLYGSRTIIAASCLREIGRSPHFRRAPDFRNALVQSIAGGNTMVMNRTARDIVVKAGLKTSAVCHDWWLYQLISGAGGTVIYDSQPGLLYRQHDRNQIGSNVSWSARLGRLRAMMRGQYRDWNVRNIAALSAVSDLLTPQNRAVLAEFAALSQMRGLTALAQLRHSGLFRQSRSGDISLALAAMLGKL